MELFLSYARQDQARAHAIQERLNQLGHSVWVDRRLSGGHQWWEEILRRIAHSDALVLVTSAASLHSQACAAERGYAAALRRPILPVLIERLPPEVLPADIQLLQLVDYTEEGADAAIQLANAVSHLPPAPPLPDELPAAPPVPLSYLAQLGDSLTSAEHLDLAQQLTIAARLEAALRGRDAEERATAGELLRLLRQRHDLLVETQRVLDRIDVAGPSPAGAPISGPTSPAGAPAPTSGQPWSPGAPAGDRPSQTGASPSQAGGPPPRYPGSAEPGAPPPPSALPRPPPGQAAGAHPGMPWTPPGTGAPAPPGVPPGAPGTSRRSNAVVWWVIGGVALFLVLLVCCLGLLASDPTYY